jgi:uncharacterized repeat protein (TIGR01451 family)
MSNDSGLFVWQNKKKFAFKKLSVVVALVMSCNLLAGIAYFATNPLKPTVLGVVSGKDGYKLRYSKTTNGGLSFTGNSICLSDAQPQGTCGTFTTIDSSLKDAPYGSGTTSDWTKNSSKATLKIPADSQILYAELIWGGSYKYKDLDLTSVLDSQINLQTPSGTYPIKPDNTTAAEVSESSAYVRTANVTEIISKDGAGNYTVSGIPATMDKTNPYNNYAGWTLAVAYRDLKQPARNLSIFVGSEQAGPDQFYNLAEVKGFATPTSGNISGKLLVSAQEGDPCYSGDQMRFGQTSTTLTALSGPNNKVSNFFASQINGDDGKLDKSGSFGSSNQSTSTCANAKRQGWDVANVDISSLLKPNQTTAYAQGSSQGDVYMINGLGVQIDVNAAKPLIELTVDKSEAKVGDVLTYTSKVTNTGTTDSNNSTFSGNTPQGTSFIPGSLVINGENESGNTPSSNLGTIKPGQAISVTYQVKVDSVPPSNKFVNQTNLDYQYNMVVGEPAISDSTKSNEVVTIYTEKPNQPPVARDDEASTDFQSPVTIDVLVNDSDPDGNLEPASLNVTKAPNNGTILPSKNNLIYTPKDGFSGVDTFEYQICDTSNLCDTAIVTVNVNKKPVEIAAPKALDDSSTTLKNTPVNVNILKNDNFDDGKPQNAVLSIISNPSNGTASIGENGQAIYTPKTDFVGTDVFEYKLCDLSTLCDSAKVTITINAPEVVNNPPVALNDNATTEKNKPVTMDILNNDSDQDGDLNPNSLTIPTLATNGTLVIENNKVIYTPNLDYTGSDSFTYQICDLINQCTTAKGTITISAPAQPDPVITVSTVTPSNDTANTTTNKPVNISILANDVASTNIATSTLGILKNPTNGTVVKNPNGTVTYTPKQDFNGEDSFTYQICNTENVCGQAIVTIKVDPGTVIPITQYTKPIAIDDQAQASPSTKVTIPVSTNDSAPNDKLDLSKIKITQNAKNGTVISNSNNGNVDYVPNIGFIGTDTFSYQICTINNACDDAVVTVVVKDPGQGVTINPNLPSNPVETNTNQSTTTPEPTQNNVIAETDSTEPSNPAKVLGVVDRQSDTDLSTKSKGQVLGAFENNQLIRTGGEYSVKILLPLNLTLIVLIFALNRLTDKKDEAVTQIYE